MTRSPRPLRRGRPRRGETRVQTKVRLTPTVHEAAVRRATAERRSLTAMIELAVLRYLDAEPAR